MNCCSRWRQLAYWLMGNYTAVGSVSVARPRGSLGLGCGEGVTVPPDDDTTVESFRGLVLRLRGRTGLTQRELAMRSGVHVSSIQGWESGDNHPGVASLKSLIAAGLPAGSFT